jgi:uncharacterized membrane protein
VTSNDALPDDAVANTKPLDVDGVNAAIAGTVVFAIAFVVLAFMRPQLAQHDAGWWLWVCAAGAVMGLGAIGYTTRRRAAYRAAGRTTR